MKYRNHYNQYNKNGVATYSEVKTNYEEENYK